MGNGRLNARVETAIPEIKVEESTDRKKKRGGLLFSLALVMLVPLTVLGIILVYEDGASVRKAMEFEVQARLQATARDAGDILSLYYPGDIKEKSGQYYIGDLNITDDEELVDHIKQNTGADITIYYGMTSIASTIEGEEYGRWLGEEVKDTNLKAAIEMGNEYYTENAKVQGEEVYIYYVPIRNGDRIVGMISASLPKNSLNVTENTLRSKIVIIFVVALLVILTLATFYVNTIVKDIRTITDYIGDVADSALDQKISDKVLNRKDEIGEMADYAMSIGSAMKELIFNDPLTQIYNRRAGRLELQKRIDKADYSERRKLTLALADIDYFKKVNDTYGHDMGDEVLIRVSGILREKLEKNGYPVRWGGEEFLLVIDKDIEEAMTILEEIADEIKSQVFDYEGGVFSVSITIGVTTFRKGDKVDAFVKRADDLLYIGKEGGRDRIVKEEEK
ncbi:MAG: diguanylate cyclase [Lachnospiraceae bacterium]|nr:diguanylate cyclase [Lachnospiraceae bacterium]